MSMQKDVSLKQERYISKRFEDMTFIPFALISGNMPLSSAVALRFIPNILGIEGPVISASRIPTS